MEKNEFYELLDGIVECADKVAKLGRLLKKFVPQFVALLPDAPIDVPAIEAKETKVQADKKKATTKKAEPKAEEVKAIITKYGASRLSDIQESDYANLMADLEVIG